jgi:hypothetical protein
MRFANLNKKFVKFYSNYLVLNKMSTVSSDYVNYSAGGSSCSYAPLGQYSADYSMGVPFQGKLTNGAYVVPTWGAIGYDALTNKVPNCSGYFDVNSAYGADAGNCQTTYRTSLCGGGGPAPIASSCSSLAPAQRTACCAEKQMKKTCDPACANAKQFC